MAQILVRENKISSFVFVAFTLELIHDYANELMSGSQ